jgi:hypothetical protein
MEGVFFLQPNRSCFLLPKRRVLLHCMILNLPFFNHCTTQFFLEKKIKENFLNCKSRTNKHINSMGQGQGLH